MRGIVDGVSDVLVGWFVRSAIHAFSEKHVCVHVEDAQCKESRTGLHFRKVGAAVGRLV